MFSFFYGSIMDGSNEIRVKIPNKALDQLNFESTFNRRFGDIRPVGMVEELFAQTSIIFIMEKYH